jgi:hypothetical protein
MAVAAACSGTSSGGHVTSNPKPGSGVPTTKVDATEQAAYLTDLARVDPALATYMQSGGDVAVKALLTDGSAFCAFLARGGGLDNAMYSVAVGANQVEAQTHLPQNVTTFNAIDAVALVHLCPDQRSALPAAARSRIDSLGSQLGAG